MKLAIYGRVYKKAYHKQLQELFDELNKREFPFFVEESFLIQCKQAGLKIKETDVFDSYAELKKYSVDFMLSIGGDGTMLDALTYILDQEIPVMGLNSGRLGFLAGVSMHEIAKSLDLLSKGHFQLDSRSVLQLEANHELFGGIKYGLNDFVIHKKDTSSMIIIHTYINGEFLNSYWSDGLIISTPTGSTGYSLSCGGPIVYPNSSSFVVTPVAPHNLNVRPIIVSDENVLSFEIEGRATSYLVSLDSRSETISSHVQLAVKKAGFKYHMVRFNDGNFLLTLREKLMWGVDNRNTG
ncbi:MAG: NAD kinase [Bacteroidia bacterium]|jgi:NAD+ kinase|nr:NAD kinase [Bacteroidia bacterium]